MSVLADYMQAAMRHAKYEILEDDASFYGHIPETPGVWANAPTLEECREELESVLEEWILLGIWWHHPIPPIDGIEVKLAEAPVEAA